MAPERAEEPVQRSTGADGRTRAGSGRSQPARNTRVAWPWSRALGAGIVVLSLNGGCPRIDVTAPDHPPATATEAVRDELTLDGDKCAQGEGRACASAALRHQHGDRTKIDLAEALSLHRRACGLGYARSCVHAATLTLRQRPYGDETESALAALTTGCEDGLPTACLFLYQLKHNSLVFGEVLRDTNITVDLHALTSACAGGDDDACAAGLETIERCDWQHWAECDAVGVEPAIERPRYAGLLAEAARPFTEALRERCGADRPRPCALLADHGPPADAERLYADACTWGHAPSCLPRADALTGVGEAAEREAMLKRACDAGLLRGCSELLREEIRRAGKTVERLRDGCELQDAVMCTEYARAMTSSGQLDEARALYERACDLGDPHGCDALGFLGSPADLDDDAELYRRQAWFMRACVLRDTPSCQRVEALARERALGAELTACRAGQIERCDLAVDALATHDPRAAKELVQVVLKQSGDACRSSSEACDAIRWIHLITGCGKYGVQKCENRTAADMRQRRKIRALDPRYHRLLHTECDRGVASSCQTIANITSGKDFKRAEKLYLRACELGDATSCDQVPAALSNYRDLSEEENVKYHEMACTAGDHGSCLYVSGYWSDKDLRLSQSLRARARELVRQGCPIGPPPGDWCSPEDTLKSLVELRMFDFVVHALRQQCQSFGDWSSCSSLEGVLRASPASWT